jgi:hypothetical protein
VLSVPFNTIAHYKRLRQGESCQYPHREMSLHPPPGSPSLCKDPPPMPGFELTIWDFPAWHRDSGAGRTGRDRLPRGAAGAASPSRCPGRFCDANRVHARAIASNCVGEGVEHRFATCAASGTPIPRSRRRRQKRREGFPPAAQVANLCFTALHAALFFDAIALGSTPDEQPLFS